MNPIYEWINASKQLPKPEDYNQDGSVIVAYEDGTVSRGYYTLNNEWAFKERHGKALFWTSYPEHPQKEEIISIVVR